MKDAAYTALPACENDLNLSLVALRLGLDDPGRFLPPSPRPSSSLWESDDSDCDSEMGSGSVSAEEDFGDVDEHMEARGDSEEDDGADNDEQQDSVFVEDVDDAEYEDAYKEPPRKRVRIRV